MEKRVLTIKDLSVLRDGLGHEANGGHQRLTRSIPRGWTIVGLALLAWAIVILAIMFAFGFIPFLPRL